MLDLAALSFWRESGTLPPASLPPRRWSRESAARRGTAACLFAAERALRYLSIKRGPGPAPFCVPPRPASRCGARGGPGNKPGCVRPRTATAGTQHSPLGRRAFIEYQIDCPTRLLLCMRAGRLSCACITLLSRMPPLRVRLIYMAMRHAPRSRMRWTPPAPGPRGCARAGACFFIRVYACVVVARDVCHL